MINEIVLYSFIRELDGSLVKPSPAMGAMYVEKRWKILLFWKSVPPPTVSGPTAPSFSLFSHIAIPFRLTGVQQVDLFVFLSREESNPKWASMLLSLLECVLASVLPRLLPLPPRMWVRPLEKALVAPLVEWVVDQLRFEPWSSRHGPQGWRRLIYDLASNAA